VQGAYISDEEIETIVVSCADQAQPGITTGVDCGHTGRKRRSSRDRRRLDLLVQAADADRDQQFESTSMCGANCESVSPRRSADVDCWMSRGVVGPSEGSKAVRFAIKRTS